MRREKLLAEQEGQDQSPGFCPSASPLPLGRPHLKHMVRRAKLLVPHSEHPQSPETQDARSALIAEPEHMTTTSQSVIQATSNVTVMLILHNMQGSTAVEMLQWAVTGVGGDIPCRIVRVRVRLTLVY